jgi:hypothetical protein
LVEPYRVAPSIELLMLTQMSWMLFWALADK